MDWSSMVEKATQGELVGTVIFFIAILHTFATPLLRSAANRFEADSAFAKTLHLLGEIEVVFGFWATIFILIFTVIGGQAMVSDFIHKLNFTEPVFVFVIMTMASTRPILSFSRQLIFAVVKILPVHKSVGFYATALIAGPLLGSFITEPAAMTLTALILRSAFFEKEISNRLKYSTLAILFVAVSAGGTLTHFAAPPVLMVAHRWNWDTPFMFHNYGWKSIIAIFVMVGMGLIFNWRELVKLNTGFSMGVGSKAKVPIYIEMIFLGFLAGAVLNAHEIVLFVGLFLFFLGICNVFKNYLDSLILRESLLVGFFLGGLVVLGSLQRWWLEPLISGLSEPALFLSATGLTAVIDNAAITYLGTHITSLTGTGRYMLMAGALAGGGLTIIANAPNPAGYGILNPYFDNGGISSIKLFLYALPFTLVLMACYWFF